MDRCFGCNRRIGAARLFIRRADWQGERYQPVHRVCWEERRGGWLWPTDTALYLRTGNTLYLQVLVDEHGPVQLRRDGCMGGAWFARCPQCNWQSVRYGSRARAFGSGEAHWIVEHRLGAVPVEAAV